MPRNRICLTKEKRTYGIRGALFANRAARRKDLRETLGVKTFYLRYYKNLLGISTDDGKSCDTFEVEKAKLQSQIDDLLLKQIVLCSQFADAPRQIKILEAEIKNLQSKIKNLKVEVQVTIKNIHKIDNLKERIATLEAILRNDNVDIENLINLMNLEE